MSAAAMTIWMPFVTPLVVARPVTTFPEATVKSATKPKPSVLFLISMWPNHPTVDTAAPALVTIGIRSPVQSRLMYGIYGTITVIGPFGDEDTEVAFCETTQ